ncbi:adenine phosphoribosyltransferase [Cavenderia fasciculata]|uniref:adenine phosphoribosyltransferase n=1 Tax=Cavenderia fasciculata TaxID=261658 RepID=F4QCS5_CACFS|nr:adenine phosphoribosyltransferase [Cavenderia fasciculata]EGG13657.1 adenine phosphoribosyltransferase [Cavenderia fasciculata]|eukprot:XP_004350361.1 adenine phosphoribosyltransferase [Cavenderia fasciculata]
MEGYERARSSAEQAVVRRSKVFNDFPSKGVSFLDITPLFLNYQDFDVLLSYWQQKFQDVELVVGLEARGFILATAIAQKLQKGVVLLRKKGKLPGTVLSETYSKEYGKDEFEIQEDIFSHAPLPKNLHILVVDDVLATGGTLCASIELVKKALAKNNIKQYKISTCVVSSIKCLSGKEKIYEKYNDVSIDVIHEI